MPLLPHIAILCSRLDLPGGIERAVVNTAHLFSRKGHSVTLVILDTTSRSFYPVDPAIRIIQQPLSFGIGPEGNIITRKLRMLSDVLALRKILRLLKPDIIISSEYPFTVAAVLCGARKYSRIWSWEHHHFHWLEKNKFWTRLYEYACRRLNGIVCLNKEEKVYYESFAPVTVIPNYVENRSGRIADPGNRQLLTIGRLIHRKGIDLLLPVAKAVLNGHPGWTWKIIGDGEMKEEVLEFIRKEKLERKLLLQLPEGNDLTETYCSASIFVLTSRFEAFPMVLLEAMSHGLPCISFDCPSGPSAIIRNGENGVLVENGNTGQMTAAASGLMNDITMRRKMSEQALIAVQSFSPEAVYEKWMELFTK